MDFTQRYKDQIRAYEDRRRRAPNLGRGGLLERVQQIAVEPPVQRVAGEDAVFFGAHQMRRVSERSGRNGLDMHVANTSILPFTSCPTAAMNLSGISIRISCAR